MHTEKHEYRGSFDTFFHAIVLEQTLNIGKLGREWTIQADTHAERGYWIARRANGELWSGANELSLIYLDVKYMLGG